MSLDFINKGMSLLMGKPKKKKRKPADPYYRKAKRLAADLGIPVSVEINREYGNGYWLETDLLEDGRFCSSWEEVYEKLKGLEGSNDNRQ